MAFASLFRPLPLLGPKERFSVRCRIHTKNIKRTHVIFDHTPDFRSRQRNGPLLQKVHEIFAALEPG